MRSLKQAGVESVQGEDARTQAESVAIDDSYSDDERRRGRYWVTQGSCGGRRLSFGQTGHFSRRCARSSAAPITGVSVGCCP